MSDLSPSQENYLKEVYIGVSRSGYAKMTRIAKALGVKKSSVNAAMNLLSERELINYAPYNQVTMTERGKEIAEKLLLKYETMIGFFTEILKLEQAEAIENSCRMEHIMSEELFKRITMFYEFTKKLHADNPKYAKQFDDFLKSSGKISDKRPKDLLM
ncbi:MAG: metal-dependent transcriptional regulator [Holosporaceae bacterium]|jgi:DtxR family Mn-dependent transcriptional regulator|nr:metal-dependent transcriptional regulator [Holosporaceae bacterium]